MEDWPRMDAATRRALAERACDRADRQALWSLMEAYVNVRRAHGRPPSPHTMRTYRQSLDSLLDHWDGQKLLHPTPSDLSSFAGDLERAGAAVSTIKVRLAGVRALYRALHWAGITRRDPFGEAQPITPEGAPRRSRQPYSSEERETLLQHAEPVDRAMILLGVRAGLSVSECVGLRWSNVDLSSGQLALQPNHERRGQTVLLPSAVVDALRVLPRGGGENVLGFASDVRARQRMKQLCIRAGVPYRGLQALRLGAWKETGSNDQEHTRSSRRERFDRNRVVARIPDFDALKVELSRVVAEADRTGSAFGLLTIDIDQLPAITDEYGLDVARELAQTCAARINRIRRPYDFVARCPGERSCVILKHIRSETDMAGIKRRFLQAVDTDPFVIQGKTFAVSARMETARGLQAAVALIGAAEPNSTGLQRSILN